MIAWLKPRLALLNTHLIGNIGGALTAIGLAVHVGLDVPQLADALKTLHVPDAFLGQVHAVAIVTIAIGGILLKYGRPGPIPEPPGTGLIAKDIPPPPHGP